MDGHYIWTAESNRFGWTSFLGVPAGSASVPKGAVPARLDDVRGLPPVFIATGTLDLFANEDIENARRLMNAGVPTELHVFPGAYHGFDGVPTASITKVYKAALDEALNRAFAPTK